MSAGPAVSAGPAGPGYTGALEAVTGHRIDLRSQVSPPTGWLIPVSPGAATWWNYYPYGVQLFGVDLNQGAIDSWHQTLGDLGSIVNEVASGAYGLMQVPVLRDAEARARSYTDLLATSAKHAHEIADPVLTSDGIAGTAADMVARMTRGVADQLDGYHTQLTETPSVAEALGGAADGLAEFGRRMAKIYDDSRDVLTNAIAEGVNGTAADLASYLALHDLATPDDILLTYKSNDPERDSAQARQVLAGFTPQGRMPAGFDPPVGDPVSGALWTSAGAAITKRLGDELDAMDTAATAALADLETAYGTATTRFGGPEAGAMQARRRLSRVLEPTDTTPAAAPPAE